jgi:hypothetical protein
MPSLKWDEIQTHRWYELTTNDGEVVGPAYWFQLLPGPHCHEIDAHKYDFSTNTITRCEKIQFIYSEDKSDVIKIFDSYTYVDISHLFYSELVYETEGSMLESIRVLTTKS